jgi:MerR family transcriptional regulator, light-induced transcriptional regulator
MDRQQDRHIGGDRPSGLDRLRGGERSVGLSVQRSRQLAHEIETRFLPRILEENALSLSLTRRRGKKAVAAPASIEEWAQLAVEDDLPSLAEHFRSALAGESDLPTLFLDILAPAARLLGQWGEEGRISFEVVDRAVRSFEDVVSKFQHDPLPNATRGWRSGSILLSASPGDLHSFGLRMVEELFRRDGWSLTTLPAPCLKDILCEVGRNHFHVLGLSIGGVEAAAAAPALIGAVRAATLNPDLFIVVGGPAVVAGTIGPETMDADYLAIDGASAIEAMRTKLPR